MNETQTEIAEKIAIEAHANQYRNDGKTPYITHPIEVSKKIRNLCRKDDEKTIDLIQAVALLHDVLEDTSCTVQYLLDNKIEKSVVAAVLLLTKPEFPFDYMDYLKIVNTNYMAKIVKIADMIHNLSDSPSPSQLKRYSNGLRYLTQ